MQGDRHSKVAMQLAELTAQFVQKEANTNPLITITHADISRDYKNATVFFTTVPDGREDDALAFLKRNGRELRRFIMKRMSLKQIPFLSFSVDYGERHRQHIDELVQESGVESTFEEEV